MDSNTIIITIICSSLGMGYILYGKKQRRLMAILSGLGLCIMPYFGGNILVQIVISIVLIVLPYFIDF